jgi:hypothetical protein
MCHVLPHPLGSFDNHMACRRLASALSWRCFPACHFQLRHPPPTVDPAVPSSPSNALVVHVPSPRSRNVLNSICMRKNISDGPSGRFWCRYRTEIISSKALCTRLSRQLLIPRIELSALLAPYRGFQRPPREARGCRRACERTPSGAAAAAPPAGALPALPL